MQQRRSGGESGDDDAAARIGARMQRTNAQVLRPIINARASFALQPDDDATHIAAARIDSRDDAAPVPQPDP